MQILHCRSQDKQIVASWLLASRLAVLHDGIHDFHVSGVAWLFVPPSDVVQDALKPQQFTPVEMNCHGAFSLRFQVSMP